MVLSCDGPVLALLGGRLRRVEALLAAFAEPYLVTCKFSQFLSSG